MNRRTKRLGCSGIKDLMESRKLEIVDEQTIMEISTFVLKGQSYEASEGNHDDLMMNLVLMGYFIHTEFFHNMTDINLKQLMYEQKISEIENDVVPFGWIDDGSAAIEEIESQEDWERKQWSVWSPTDANEYW